MSNAHPSTTTAEKAVAIAAIGVVLGAFLPWVSIFGISVAGIKKDGAITLAIAVVGLVVFAAHRLARRPSRKSMLVVEIAGGALVALIAVIDLNGLAAGGLYLTLLSGIGWAVAAFIARRETPTPAGVGMRFWRSRPRSSLSALRCRSRFCRSSRAG